METGLRGKTVLVTETGNPLGKGSALAFAREGANLVLGSTADGQSIFEAGEEASNLGAKVVAIPYDAGSEDRVKQFVQRGLDEFGPIDVLVNNVARAGATRSFATLSFDVWRRAIHDQLTASLFLCRAVLPAMIEQGWGRMIHYIGLAGFVGSEPVTSTAHMGIIGLTRGIATQYGKYRITANCIGSGGVEGLDDYPDAYPSSKLNDPLARYGTAQEVSSAAIYLASEGAGYITGQCYLVNGGRWFL
jgi:3-oxoacyl-[acyl-carrier protein] reductase